MKCNLHVQMENPIQLACESSTIFLQLFTQMAYEAFCTIWAFYFTLNEMLYIHARIDWNRIWSEKKNTLEARYDCPQCHTILFLFLLLFFFLTSTTPIRPKKWILRTHTSILSIYAKNWSGSCSAYAENNYKNDIYNIFACERSPFTIIIEKNNIIC